MRIIERVLRVPLLAKLAGTNLIIVRAALVARAVERPHDGPANRVPSHVPARVGATARQHGSGARAHSAAREGTPSSGNLQAAPRRAGGPGIYETGPEGSVATLSSTLS